MKFKEVSMPCTEEQWLNVVKPLCDKYELKYRDIDSFNIYRYLTNNFNGEDGIITNIFELAILDYNRTEIPYNPRKNELLTKSRVRKSVRRN